jgi:cysteine desulfurase/selenocysteine lyase
MSTSDPSEVLLPSGAPSDGAGFGQDPFSALTGEISRLANQLFAQGPLSAPHQVPSALNVGGGGVSGLAPGHPPTPGFLQQPPIANAPVPKESDLRTIPAALSAGTGLDPLAAARSPDAAGATPYFLETAGQLHAPSASTLPGGLPAYPGGPLSSGAPALSGGPSLPGAPALSGGPSLPGAPALSGGPSSPPGAPVFPTQFEGLEAFSPESLGLSLSVPASAPLAPPLDPPAMPAPGNLAPSSGAVPAGAPPTGDSFGGLAPETPPAAPRAPTPGLEAFEVRPELVPNLGTQGGQRGVFDAASIKKDFPILSERVHGRQLVWLDNAATTQKPQAVIDRLSYYYEHENSNVHRAAHTLSARATDAYEGARDKVRRFLNAPSAQEIIFARGATEAINLVAKSWGHRNVKAGDEIVITWLEHHANIVPWQQLCAEKGARLCVAPVDATGQVILEEYEKLLGPRTRLVSITQVSNALGTITPAREMVQMAHRHGALALVDGAQAVSHMPVDVQALDCDFYCFSGHKVFAPTGIGALFGKADVLAAMPPWQGGGNMIRDVTFEKTTYQAPPWKFEAGTGSIADAVGLGAAIDYVSAIGLENISRYEHELLVYATERLLRIPGLTIIGTAAEKAGVISLVLNGVRTEDVGAALDREGIAVRSGHHCAQPILRRFGLEATVRASLAPYNTVDDIDALCAALARLQVGQAGRPL